MAQRDTSFARLVSLAAHDLRTPLATIHGFAQTLVRMGGLDEVECHADGATLRISPVTSSSADVLVGDDLRDLGPAVAVRLVEALGGAIERANDSVLVRLPT